MAVAAIVILIIFTLAGCGNRPVPVRTPQEIIEEMIVDYGNYGEDASTYIEILLKELSAEDADLGSRWDRIIKLWKSVNFDQSIYYDVLPDGLSDSNDLCLVVLGFQLEPDGTMRNELIERLTVALNSATKYPNAYIVCTGGGTASGNKSATEAGEMAKWLIENGIEENRVIVEDQSLTTAQNAIYTYGILADRYPEIRQIAIISSDYHIATGTLLFDAEFILQSESTDKTELEVVSNAGWKPLNNVSGRCPDRTFR